jgi:hypothetical protein
MTNNHEYENKGSYVMKKRHLKPFGLSSLSKNLEAKKLQRKTMQYNIYSSSSIYQFARLLLTIFREDIQC